MVYACGGVLQHLRDGGGAERALPLAADAHDGAVGAARVHPRAAAAARHAPPALPPRPAPQSLVSAPNVHYRTTCFTTPYDTRNSCIPI